jgi:3-deoxy-D-manno-octulosonic-acid transferase
MIKALIYDMAFLICFILALPVLWAKGKLHRGYWARLGFLPAESLQRIAKGKNIWFHAVSVGEVLALVDLIKKTKEDFPQYGIVLTTVTKNGYALACRQFPRDPVLFAPLDLSWVIAKFIRLIDPKVYIAAETEIWPNLYRSLHNRGVTLLQVNGRISDKSLKGYVRFKRLLQRTLNKIDLFCMQSELDAQRIYQMGARPEKIKVTGNIKFDHLPEDSQVKRGNLGYANDDKLLIAGSTHAPEEEALLSTFAQLRELDNSLRLILCPRHIERGQELKELVEKSGLKPTMLSDLNGRPLRQEDVLVVDRIGVLRDLYALASFVFVGKSLSVGGGQNMIEPAAFGKPVVVGPMTQNFKDVVRIFLAEKALVVVKDESELKKELADLIKNPAKAADLGRRALGVVQKYRGASERTMGYIRPHLAKK